MWIRPRLTPPNADTRDEQPLAGSKRLDHDGVQVQPLTEHPGEVGHRRVLRKHVHHPAPQLEKEHSVHD